MIKLNVELKLAVTNKIENFTKVLNCIKPRHFRVVMRKGLYYIL